MRFALLTIFAILFINNLGFGQSNVCQKKAEGKDFWFGFMEGRHYPGSGVYTEITVTSSHYCKYSIYIGKSKIPFVLPAPLDGTVKPNIPVQIRVPWDQVEAIGSEPQPPFYEQKAIHLVSDSSMSVYALNFATYSSEASLIYPTPFLGKQYYTMCYYPDFTLANDNAKDIDGKNSEFLIVASEDSTVVNIWPSALTDKNVAVGQLKTIKLNRGEVYQVQAANTANPTDSDSGDLTGSYITSTEKIAVFSGSYATTIPKGTWSAWEHLYEQMPPIQSWGTKFVAVPLATRHEDTYRVLASKDSTTVQLGSFLSPVFLRHKGDFSEFSLSYNQASMIQSDKPVLLAQFSNSRDVDAKVTNYNGDPFMVILNPVEQTREKAAFVAYTSPEIVEYFINVVVADSVVGNIFLDGNKINFQSLNGSGYSYAQVPLINSQGNYNHYIESTVKNEGFIAWVYGFGGVEAYGYNLGYDLNVKLNLGNNINGMDKFLVRCDRAGPLTIDAGDGFIKYVWNTGNPGDTTSIIHVTNSGWYKLKATTSEGCVLTDSVEVRISKPSVFLGRDTTICNPSTIVLDAGQFSSWLWSTPTGHPTTQSVVASNPSYYSVVVKDLSGCPASDTIKVSFADKPKLNVSRLDTLICGSKSAVLNLSANIGNYTLQRTDTGEKFQNLNAVVSAFGTYPFKFTAMDQYGCYRDTAFKLGFHKIPTVHFSIDSTKCYHYNLTANYNGDATINAARFTWVFGGDTIADGIGITSDTVPLGINKNKRDLSLRVVEQGCSNTYTIKDIKVIPNFSFQIADSLGCQPFSAEFIAHNTETVFYDWNFGDGTIKRLDNHPIHTYKNAGYYNVSLKVTTVKGCTNSISVDSMLYVAPVPTAGFTPYVKGECLASGDHPISYSGNGDTADKYVWNLSSFDSGEIIKNPGNTQGPLIFNLKNKPQANIGLKVISKYGCLSKDSTILVKRKPVFSFSSSSNTGCTPLELLFTGKANDPVDRLNYTWDFGDGANGSGDTADHIYTVPDHQYDIILNALSSVTSCFDTISKKGFVITRPEPHADFIFDNKIVYNDKPTINFSNLSTGATFYSWDFGDGSISSESNPSHYFTATGYRTVLLEAFNNYSCFDTMSYRILVAVDNIFPPNAFSPNAPNPVDREYKLTSVGVMTEGYHLEILSRWNDIVFEARDEIKGWDGRMKNGDFAPAGNYLWILDYNDFLGRRHRQTGTVTLIY